MPPVRPQVLFIWDYRVIHPRHQQVLSDATTMLCQMREFLSEKDMLQGSFDCISFLLAQQVQELKYASHDDEDDDDVVQLEDSLCVVHTHYQTDQQLESDMIAQTKEVAMNFAEAPNLLRVVFVTRSKGLVQAFKDLTDMGVQVTVLHDADEKLARLLGMYATKGQTFHISEVFKTRTATTAAAVPSPTNVVGRNGSPATTTATSRSAATITATAASAAWPSPLSAPPPPPPIAPRPADASPAMGPAKNGLDVFNAPPPPPPPPATSTLSDTLPDVLEMLKHSMNNQQQAAKAKASPQTSAAGKGAPSTFLANVWGPLDHHAGNNELQQQHQFAGWPSQNLQPHDLATNTAAVAKPAPAAPAARKDANGLAAPPPPPADPPSFAAAVAATTTTSPTSDKPNTTPVVTAASVVAKNKPTATTTTTASATNNTKPATQPVVVVATTAKPSSASTSTTSFPTTAAAATAAASNTKAPDTFEIDGDSIPRDALLRNKFYTNCLAEQTYRGRMCNAKGSHNPLECTFAHLDSYRVNGEKDLIEGRDLVQNEALKQLRTHSNFKGNFCKSQREHDEQTCTFLHRKSHKRH